MTRRMIAIAALVLSMIALAAFAQQASKPDDKTAKTNSEAKPAGCPMHDAAKDASAPANCPMHAKGEHSADCPMHASAAKDGSASAGCPMAKGKSGAMQHGAGMGHGQAMQHGAGMQMRGMSGDHEAIHSLMAEHKSVKRTVADIPNGVRTDTTSSDPKVTTLIRTHVRQMQSRIENGQPIRMFDPLFQEIFANSDKIKLQIEDIEGGVRVTETSADPNVVLLVRKHARAVDSFVADGMAKMHEPTPLPEGYKPAGK